MKRPRLSVLWKPGWNPEFVLLRGILWICLLLAAWNLLVWVIEFETDAAFSVAIIVGLIAGYHFKAYVEWRRLANYGPEEYILRLFRGAPVRLRWEAEAWGRERMEWEKGAVAPEACAVPEGRKRGIDSKDN